MSETKELLRRGAEGFAPREGVMDSLPRLRARKERNHRIAAVALAIGLTLATFAGLIRTFSTVRRPADEPRDIFARVHGWITYGTGEGIWAVNPERPAEPEGRVQLSDQAGEPIAWSADGSALLILRGWLPDGTAEFGPPISRPGLSIGLVVLHADGTETRVVTVEPYSQGSQGLFGSSLSPDGSKVVYSDGSSIYVVDADGGTPRLLRRASGLMVYLPAFSADGTKIAYFDGVGDFGHSLRVMNADGTHVRVLFGQNQPLVNVWAHVAGLTWSSDGSHLAFDVDYPVRMRGIWLIRADGSGLRHVIHGGATPNWSPDGSRIAYREERSLRVANLDGTHVRTLVAEGLMKNHFWLIGAVPWNPLPQSAPGGAGSAPVLEASGAGSVPADRESRATEGGSVAAPLYAIAALGALAVLVLMWRARRNAKARN